MGQAKRPKTPTSDSEAIRGGAIVTSVGGLTRGDVMRMEGGVLVAVRLVILVGIILEACFLCVSTAIRRDKRSPNVRD